MVPFIYHKFCRKKTEFLETTAHSCGAAVEGISPRRQPWVAVLAIGAAKRRKEILFGPNSVALDRAFGDGAFSPRLTPWATLFRHTVADGWRSLERFEL